MNQIVETKAVELRHLIGIDPETEKELSDIETKVTTKYSLADAIREGCLVTKPAQGWGTGETACALSAAYIAAKARGFV
jgi:hypothetical protein